MAQDRKQDTCNQALEKSYVTTKRSTKTEQGGAGTGPELEPPEPFCQGLRAELEPPDQCVQKLSSVETAKKYVIKLL